MTLEMDRRRIRIQQETADWLFTDKDLAHPLEAAPYSSCSSLT